MALCQESMSWLRLKRLLRLGLPRLAPCLPVERFESRLLHGVALAPRELDELLLLVGDAVVPAGERLDELVADTVDLVHAGLAVEAFAPVPLHAQALGELVHEQVRVPFADRDGGAERAAAVQGAGLAVGALHEVGDEDVVVQVGVVVARVPVRVGDGHDALGALPDDAPSAGAGAGDVGLEPCDGFAHGLLVGLRDGGAHVLVAAGPQDVDAFGHVEGQVVAAHDLARLDALVVHAHELLAGVGLAQPVVEAVHLLVRRLRSGLEAVASQPAAEPHAGRGSRRVVVVGHAAAVVREHAVDRVLVVLGGGAGHQLGDAHCHEGASSRGPSLVSAGCA
jgi:hypothetical protein